MVVQVFLFLAYSVIIANEIVLIFLGRVNFTWWNEFKIICVIGIKFCFVSGGVYVCCILISLFCRRPVCGGDPGGPQPSARARRGMAVGHLDIFVCIISVFWGIFILI